MNKRQRSNLTLLAAGALGAVLLWGTQDQWGDVVSDFIVPVASAAETGSGNQRAPRGVPVIVAAVDEQRDDVVVEAIGTARAVRHVMLFPAVADEVLSVAVQSGDRVEPGQIIVRLDDRNAALAVRVSETRVKEAESALERAERLRDNNVRSRANVEDAEIILERAKLELSQARAALADRTLRAPFAGIVGIPKVEVGDRVTTDTEIVTVDDRESLLVEFEIAERFLSRINTGMPVTARTSAFQDTVVNGQIVKIDSRIDPISRTVLIRAGFDNTADRLRPGMSFFVRLDLTGKMYASVPELALQWRDGQSYVWIIEDGKAKRVNVTPKRRFNSRVLIEGDVQLGEMVVVEGVQRLRNGRAVEIAQTEASQ